VERSMSVKKKVVRTVTSDITPPFLGSVADR
jgi:hypothetical protein